MKESDYRKKWKRSFFRLEDGRLSYYAKKAVANAKPTKTMELTAQSTTSHATIDKCFYVTTEKVGGGGATSASAVVVRCRAHTLACRRGWFFRAARRRCGARSASVSGSQPATFLRKCNGVETAPCESPPPFHSSVLLPASRSLTPPPLLPTSVLCRVAHRRRRRR